MDTEDKYYYDEASAERPIKWIEKFCTTANGEPMRLLEYQKRDIIRPMFGWKNADDSYKHRFCYIEIGKGNGKSGLLSALAAYLCFASGEQNAEIYCIATDRKQAGIVHEDIKKLVRGHPKLESKSVVHRDTIAYHEKQNKIKAVSSDVGSSHGWRPHALIFDELHTYKDSELFDSYIAGLIKRKNSMAFILTTAGKRETFAETIHDMCVGIMNGTVESPYWHTAIYAADPTDPPFEETTFRKANPAYGELIRPQDFDIIVDRARNTPSNLATYKQLHLNIWTGKLEDWVTADEWHKCNIGMADDEYKHLPAYGGLDLAAVRDLTAFGLLWQLPDGRIVWRSWFWVPEGTVEARVAQENHKYRQWVDEGWIRLTPGNAQDHDQVAAEIMEICSQYLVREIRFDRWGAVGAVTKLAEQGLPLIGHGQGFAGQSAPTKELERRIVNGEIDHGGNPVLSWMLNNCRVISDPAGNIKLNKDDKHSKIDGIAAGIMAMAALMQHEKQPEGMPEDWTPTFF